MTRYKVPRIVFINKCDRTGANPYRVVQQVREKLDLNAVMLQMPIGLEADLKGVVDLVTMKAIYFEGDNGEVIRETDIPAELQEEADAKREELLDAASMYSEELMEAILEGTPTEEMIRDAVRIGTLSLELVPVFMGSAYKNKGVQSMLDAVTAYLPTPKDIHNTALDLANDEKEIVLTTNADDPLVSLAFKLEDGRYGQLTYVRIYQGTMKKGDTIINSRDGKKVKIGRLVRMHSDEMEEIQEAASGDIVALFGIDCASGDTFTSPEVSVSMSSMFVPEPVISLAIIPEDNKAQVNMSKALNRFTKPRSPIVKQLPRGLSLIIPTRSRLVVPASLAVWAALWSPWKMRNMNLSIRSWEVLFPASLSHPVTRAFRKVLKKALWQGPPLPE
jgi:elongation factor G